MYTSIWKKYMPVIRILLKKSMKEQQVFLMNIPDFERAGLKRKTGLKFLLKLNNRKPVNIIVDVPLASSLVSVLQEEEAIQDILIDNEFHFSLNTKYELTIMHQPQPDAALRESAVEAE
jgi:hypothetical protein